MNVDVLPKAQKDIAKLDATTRKTILMAIKDLENFPHTGNIKKLVEHKPAYRKRVGDYRILFDVENDLIEVGRVLRRDKAYE